MESLSAGGPGWQVLIVSGRQAGGGSTTLAGQKVDNSSGDWRQCKCEYHGRFDFPQSILLWRHRIRSLGCQHEL
jgi:hypothetical protein